MTNNTELKQAGLSQQDNILDGALPKKKVIHDVAASIELAENIEQASKVENTNSVDLSKSYGTGVNRSSVELNTSQVKDDHLKRVQIRKAAHTFRYFTDRPNSSIFARILTFLSNLLKLIDRLIFGKLKKEQPQPGQQPLIQQSKKGNQEEEEVFSNVNFQNKTIKTKKKNRY